MSHQNDRFSLQCLEHILLANKQKHTHKCRNITRKAKSTARPGQCIDCNVITCKPSRGRMADHAMAQSYRNDHCNHCIASSIKRL